MQRSVVFFAYDETLGVTYHLADWWEALRRQGGSSWSCKCLTVPAEQEPGLRMRLRSIALSEVFETSGNLGTSEISVLRSADVVHCHGFRQLRRTIDFRKRYGLHYKTVLTLHSFRNGHWHRPLFTNAVSAAFFQRGLDGAHFLSLKSRDEFLKWNFLYNHRLPSSVFCLGCNLDEFRSPIEPPDELAWKAELLDDGKRVAYLAKFTAGKQHRWLVAALGELLKEEDATLYLLGDGPLKKEIEAEVAGRGLSRQIRCVGRVQRQYIPWFLSRIRLAVCSSHSETFAHALMEPVCAGLPVITFDVGTAAYLLRDFSTGFVTCGTPAPEEFQRKLRILLRDDALAARMGRNVTCLADGFLSWDECARNTLGFYDYVLRG